MSDDPNDRGLSRKHIMRSIDNSLHRSTDYVDLYQIHHPESNTPIEETLETPLCQNTPPVSSSIRSYPSPAPA